MIKLWFKKEPIASPDSTERPAANFSTLKCFTKANKNPILLAKPNGSGSGGAFFDLGICWVESVVVTAICPGSSFLQTDVWAMTHINRFGLILQVFQSPTCPCSVSYAKEHGGSDARGIKALLHLCPQVFGAQRCGCFTLHPLKTPKSSKFV